MIRSTKKEAIEALKGYIVNNFNFEDNPAIPETFEAVADAVMKDCHACMIKGGERSALRWHGSYYDIFENWLRGLPSSFDACYFYNRSAVEDLATILQETPDEARGWSESQAEKRLSQLIYRECSKVRPLHSL